MDALLFRSSRFDLNVDCDVITNHRNSFDTLAPTQTELTPSDRRGRYPPSSSLILSDGLRRSDKFHLKGYWPCHAMHRQVANNFTRIRACFLCLSTLERDFRKLLHIEKISAPQMLVSFCDGGVDAGCLNRNRDR